jgi:hypothetical protein
MMNQLRFAGFVVMCAFLVYDAELGTISACEGRTWGLYW